MKYSTDRTAHFLQRAKREDRAGTATTYKDAVMYFEKQESSAPSTLSVLTTVDDGWLVAIVGKKSYKYNS